jgi:hypothetical protein
LLTDEKAWGHYSGKSLGRAGEITFGRFEEEIKDLTNKLLSTG